MRTVLSLWLPRLALPAILLLTLIAYGQVIGFDFVDWDDTSLVLGNALVQQFSLAIFWSFEPELYSPLSLLSFQIEHALVGFEPSLFHITNLLLHLINIILVWKLLQILMQSQIVNRKSQIVFAFLGTALFTLHPVQVETVAWISARKELLWTLFGLLALLAYTQGPKDAPRAHPALRFAMRHRVTIFTLLALLSKPTAATLPFLMLAIDWRNERLNMAAIQEKWSLLALAGLVGLLGLLGKADSTAMLSVWERPLLIPAELAYAFRLLLWPYHYSVLHPAPTPIALLSPLYGGAVIFACVLGMLLWKSRKRFPVLLLGSALFFLPLLPGLLSPVHAETVTLGSEHYLYFPIIGVAIALSGLLAKSQIVNPAYRLPTGQAGTGRRKSQIALSLALTILLAFLSVSTFFQVSAWRDSTTLFESVRTIYPRSVPVLTNLGAAYARMEKFPEAESLLRQAVGLDPDFAQAHFNLGGLRYVRGDYPGAIAAYKRVIELQPRHVDAWKLLTWSYYRSGDLVRARDAYDTTVHLRPTAREQLPDLRGSGVAQ